MRTRFYIKNRIKSESSKRKGGDFELCSIWDEKENGTTFEEELNSLPEPNNEDAEPDRDIQKFLNMPHSDFRKRVLILRYGLDGNPTRSWNEVAEALGKSRVSCQMAECKGLQDIRSHIGIGGVNRRTKTMRFQVYE